MCKNLAMKYIIFVLLFLCSQALSDILYVEEGFQNVSDLGNRAYVISNLSKFYVDFYRKSLTMEEIDVVVYFMYPSSVVSSCLVTFIHNLEYSIMLTSTILCGSQDELLWTSNWCSGFYIAHQC